MVAMGNKSVFPEVGHLNSVMIDFEIEFARLQNGY